MTALKKPPFLEAAFVIVLPVVAALTRHFSPLTTKLVELLFIILFLFLFLFGYLRKVWLRSKWHYIEPK